MNEKKVTRFIRAYPTDQAACETWLADMAAKGLHLTEMRRFFAIFERRAPTPHVRFRVDPVSPSDSGDGFPEDARAAYAEMGWEYVDTCQRLYRIFRADDPAAPELHTDPATQALTLGRVIRQYALGSAVVYGLLLFCFAVALWSCHTSSTPVLDFARLSTLFAFLLAVLVCWAVVDWRFELGRVLRLRRALRSGQALEHKPVRRPGPPVALVSLLLLSVLLARNAVNLAQPYDNGSRPITDPTGLPYVSLAALEGDGFRYLYEAPGEPGTFHYYTRARSPLMPEWTRTCQGGEIAGRYWEGARTDVPKGLQPRVAYSARLYITRCRMLTEGLADAVYDELSQGPYTWYSFGDFVPLDADCGRAAIAAEVDEYGKPSTALLLQKGGTVLLVEYTGEVDLTEHLDEFTALLA